MFPLLGLILGHKSALWIYAFTTNVLQFSMKENVIYFMYIWIESYSYKDSVTSPIFHYKESSFLVNTQLE